MNYELTGKLIEKYDAQKITERFTKREFVLEMPKDINGSIYTDYIKLQLTNNKIDIIDRFAVGADIRVHFNLRGSKSERDGKTNYFTNLEAWRVEDAMNNTTGSPQQGGGYNQGGFNPGNQGGGYNPNNQGGGYNAGNQGGYNNQQSGYNNPPPPSQQGGYVSNTQQPVPPPGDQGMNDGNDDLPF